MAGTDPLPPMLHDVVACRRLAAGKQRKHPKAFMCSSWGSLATLKLLAGSARGSGALQAAAFASREDAPESKSVHQVSPEVQDRGRPCTWGLCWHTLGTGAAASEM